MSSMAMVGTESNNPQLSNGIKTLVLLDPIEKVNRENVLAPFFDTSSEKCPFHIINKSHILSQPINHEIKVQTAYFSY